MSSLPERLFSLPFVFRGKHLFSVNLHLAVREVSLPDALAGGRSDDSSDLFVPAGVDGCLLCKVPDPGWRTHTLYDDRVAYVLARDTWHYLSLAGGYDGFLENRYSAKTRESFARDEARFAAQFGGALDLREYRSAAQLAEFAELSRALCGDAGQVDVVRAKDLGGLVGFVLFADGAPIACLGLQSQGDTLLYVCAGEREDFRQWSAGAIVHLQAIRRLFADPSNRYVDFRPGDCEVKRQFANGALRSAVVLNLRRTLRNRLILSAYSLTRQLSAGREEAAVVPEAIRELLVFAG
ncbi:GNAT family N-acetyltransferase [Zoogloea oleivorans]|uniref:GNAT family N-acetyltransferase n=1 Tax=Zoogloea oleivorans TaxID=1552750 RepID=A0A6C2CLR8_9RHOO|nr:GNAT family N-acetyltransferase [Zoogloea oleivorans]TYC54292.1 GNAT family N-acetyltransferase [Zoogloea oleivorans]